MQTNNTCMSLNGMGVVNNQQQRIRRVPNWGRCGGSTWEAATGGHQQLWQLCGRGVRRHNREVFCGRNAELNQPNSGWCWGPRRHSNSCLIPNLIQRHSLALEGKIPTSYFPPASTHAPDYEGTKATPISQWRDQGSSSATLPNDWVTSAKFQCSVFIHTHKHCTHICYLLSYPCNSLSIDFGECRWQKRWDGANQNKLSECSMYHIVESLFEALMIFRPSLEKSKKERFAIKCISNHC